MQLRGMLETSLYPAVKRFLETTGFRAKGEVNGCDAVAVRDEQPERLAIVEMKRGFSLAMRNLTNLLNLAGGESGMPSRAWISRPPWADGGSPAAAHPIATRGVACRGTSTPMSSRFTTLNAMPAMKAGA
jgi:hypothetical protein